LPHVITETKRVHYYRQILIPTTMWNIMKSVACRKVKNEYMCLLNTDGSTTNNYQGI